MMVNKYRPHVWMIPEDDANRQLANGFLLHYAVAEKNAQVSPPANGWPKVLEVFETEYLPLLYNYPDAHVVLLIDFDNDGGRRVHFEDHIPQDVRDRVFVIGSSDNPETLRKEANLSFEKIGDKLAQNCFDDEYDFWNHENLAHNHEELQRLREIVRPILFSDP